jgi:uncharacterized protein YajQ (UPF0234 family)
MALLWFVAMAVNQLGRNYALRKEKSQCVRMRMRKQLLLSASTRERNHRISSAGNITQPNAQMDSQRRARMAQRFCLDEAEKERGVERARVKAKEKEIKETEGKVETKGEVEKEKVRATEDRQALTTLLNKLGSKVLQMSLSFHNGLSLHLEKE